MTQGLKANSSTPGATTTVQLIAWPQDVVKTIHLLWEASRTDKPMDQLYGELASMSEEEWIAGPLNTFKKVVLDAIPVSENLSFTFVLDGVPIELREQLVRHRIGVKVGDRLGADIIPNLSDSTWWSQSMRVIDMGRFADEEKYHVPESMRRNARQMALWTQHMERTQVLYRMLVEDGIPREDARGVIPLAATHRISWTLNLAAISHILGKRGCWILQLGLWRPVILGMMAELTEKVHPFFSELITPPCLKPGTNQYTGCKFQFDNDRRLIGADPLPPCRLWWEKEGKDAWVKDPTTHGVSTRWISYPRIGGDPRFAELYPTNNRDGAQLARMEHEYATLWRRDVRTGKQIEEGDNPNA